MFICNFKINKKKFVRIFTIIVVILAITLLILSFDRIFSRKNINSTDSKILNINSTNYTNFLKDCHGNIDKYVGTTVTITGYIYRMPDFKDNQFVLARTMLLNSNNKAVVVGILCEANQSKNYKDYTWVICKGVIKKGNYHGDMPILEISELENATAPEEEFVYSPED